MDQSRLVLQALGSKIIDGTDGLDGGETTAHNYEGEHAVRRAVGLDTAASSIAITPVRSMTASRSVLYEAHVRPRPVSEEAVSDRSARTR